MQFNKFTADCQRKLIIYQSVIFFHRVVMDVFKMEREIDPLAIERSNNTDVEEQKYLSEDGIKTDYGLKSEMAFDETLVPIDFPVVKSEVEEGNVLDLHVTEIKLECMDPTYDLKSEMTFEESPMPVDFPIVKRQAEEEQSDLDTVNEDPRVKVAAEDEIFTERIAATNERTVSPEFHSIAVEENDIVCGIPKNSGSSEKPVRTREDEKELEFKVSEICFSNSAKLNGQLSKDVGKKPFKCDVCRKSFPAKSSLKSHERLHRNEKAFKCDVCDKFFSHLSNLRTHERLHTGEKPFKCDFCGKSFANSSNLKAHERLHTGEKPFQCDVCGMCFSQSSSQKRHKLVHTGEKPFRCDICGKDFTKLSNLKCHARLHTGEKPFKCDVCGVCFSQSSSLKYHEHLHTGEKPFRCDVCGMLFSKSSSLKRHERLHTSEQP
ncbi:zinc finger protein 235-like isoform X2 [Periplaneta americana]|uniref:C2H2-type domain-containing protein n=2 Tax=Periplaneta americana TaxID=6978 RepID=A0ABQ8T769_PERAM|nr:hypothetical protein ANN_03917 [Periplaneta americana]